MAGSNSAINIPMMAMTTSNSTSVKARRCRECLGGGPDWGGTWSDWQIEKRNAIKTQASRKTGVDLFISRSTYSRTAYRDSQVRRAPIPRNPNAKSKKLAGSGTDFN